MAARVRRAVFPVAGFGTRFLPATKAQPKEMLTLVDKPIIQYGVEEAVASGVDNIILVTGRGKNAIEDHFDVSYELERHLAQRGQTDVLEQVRAISNMINVSYVRQGEQLGLGHAVLQARDLVGDEPFAVILADDLIDWRLVNRYEIFPEWRHRYPPEVTHNTAHVFSLQLPAARAVTVAPNEHLGYRWLPWRLPVFPRMPFFTWDTCRARLPSGGLSWIK